MINWRQVPAMLATAGLVAPVPVLAAEEEPLRLRPTSAWVVDFGEDSCSLRSSFGNDDASAFLEFVNTGTDDGFRLLVAAKGIRPTRKELEFRFLPDIEALDAEKSVPIELPDGYDGFIFESTYRPAAEHRLAMQRIAAEEEPEPWAETARNEREKAITGIQFSNGFNKRFILETGPIHDVMNVMRQCTDTLIRSLGLDPVVLKKLSRPPSAKHRASWVRKVQQYYPLSMRAKGQQAAISVRLIVDPEGRPSDCYVRQDGQRNEFTDTACTILLKEAQFEPALDETGRPTPSIWRTRIIYRLN